MEMPADVQVQLEQMQSSIWQQKAAISYESEGWAQFIAGWMADSEEMTRRMPDQLLGLIRSLHKLTLK